MSQHWHQHAGDAARSGVVSQTPSTSWAFAWAIGPNATTGDDDTWLGDVPNQAYPICGGGRLYQPRGTDGIRCWDLADGSAEWNNTAATFNGPGAYHAPSDTVLFGATSGLLYRLNASTGATLATYDTSSAIHKAVALVGDHAYVVCVNGGARKIHVPTMTLVWSYSGGSSSGQVAQSHPAVGLSSGISKLVYATADGYVHGVLDTTGVQSWRVKPYTPTWTADHSFDGAHPVIASQHGVVLIRCQLPHFAGNDSLAEGPVSGRFPDTAADAAGDTIRTWFGTRASPGSGAAYANVFAIDMDDGAEFCVPAVGFNSVEWAQGGTAYGVMGSQPLVEVHANGDEVVYIPFRNKDISDAVAGDYRWDTTFGEMVLDGTTVSGLEAGDCRFIQSNNAYPSWSGGGSFISDEQCFYSKAGTTAFHAHWSAVESFDITDRGDSLGLTFASPIAATRRQFIARGTDDAATTNFTTRVASAGGNQMDGRFYAYPHWFVYKGVQEPPGPNNADPFTYSAGMRPRLTFVHADKIISSGNGGSLFVLTHAGTVAAAPTLGTITDNRADYASSQVPRASRLEVNIASITTTATKPKHPYDPNAPSGVDGTLGITVDVLFSDDDFATWDIAPAYYEPVFTHLTNADSPTTIAVGQDWLYPTTTFRWTAKFSPPSTGTWKYRVSAEDAGGTSVSAVSSAVTVVSSAAKGIIRQAVADTRYFEYADGTFAWPVGGNASEIGDNQSNVTDIDMDDGASGNAVSFAAHKNAGGVNFLRFFVYSMGIQSNAGSPWLDFNVRTRLAMLARDGETADAGSGSDAAWRLDNRSYAITTTGTLTSGTYTITVDGQTTSAIPYNAAASNVYDALKVLSNIGEPNVHVDLAGGATQAVAGAVMRVMPTADCALPTTVSISSSVAGGTIALTSTGVAIGSRLIFSGWMKRSAPVKPSTVYKISLRYRIPTTLVAADANASGLTVKLDPIWINDPSLFGISGSGSYIVSATSGSGGTAQKALTNTGSGWATLVGYYATGSTQRWLPYTYVVLENCSTTSGGQVCYVDSITAEETDGSGNVNGPQVMHRYDADFHQEWDEQHAKALDLILTEAQTNGIGIKAVMNGVDTLVGSFTDANGVGLASNDNFYGPESQVITRGRWWLRSWWRYLHARWGHFASVHTWELMNEGDPLNGRHANLTRMFGDYLGQKASQFANSHLTTTSSYHSWPRKFWIDAGLQLANAGVDYSDVHLYVRDPASFSGMQTYRSDLLSYDGSNATNINIYDDDPSADWRDYPLNIDRLGDQIGANGSQGLGAPVMRGETGLYDSSTDFPSGDIATDTNLIWLHKQLWGQLHPSGFMDASWWYWRTHIYDRLDGSPNQLAKFKPWSDFVSALDLNTGGFADAAPTTPHADLRGTGLKHTTSGKVYLWIDHLSHRWTDVIASVTPTARSGDVTVSGMPNGTYDVSWYDPYTSGSTPSSTTTATCSGGTLTLTMPAAVSTDIAVKAVFSLGGGPVAAKSDFLELELLDHVLGGAAYSAPATVYMSLYTAAPTDAGGGTEVTGNAYARVAVTNNATNWPAASAGSKSNGVAFTFPQATPSGWGVVTHFGIHDAATTGNLLYWAALTASKTIDPLDTPSFAIGAIVVTED